MYAKLDEQNQLILATPEDDVTQGDWRIFEASEKPTETVLHRYSPIYSLVTDAIGESYRIVQSWVQTTIEPSGRVCRLNGNTLEAPPTNLTLPDGGLICNAYRLPKSQLLDYGFFVVREAEQINDGQTYRETGVLVDDPEYGQVIQVILEAVPPVPEPPFAISKILLKEAMVKLGKWEAFKQVLISDADAYESFMFAVVLMSDDERVIQFKAVCIQMFGFTESQVDDLLKSCKSDLA